MGPAILGKKLKKARELLASGDFSGALNLYTSLAEEFPSGYGECGAAAAASGDLALADYYWQKLRAHEPKNASVLSWLAEAYAKAALFSQSRALWMEAARLEPDKLDLQLHVAFLLARTDSPAEVRPLVNHCLELARDSAEARFLSAHLDRFENKFDSAEQQLRGIIASTSPSSSQTRYSCHADLAYILDRTGRFAEAMTVLEQGKNLARETTRPNPQKIKLFELHQKEVRDIIALPKNVLQTWARSFPTEKRASVPPVAFLTGVARSGTTLMERILDAHPTIAACDESSAFDRIQRRIQVSAASVVPVQRLNVFRQHYLKNFSMALGKPPLEKILLDKNPSRLTWLPALLRLFPEMRVIVGLRDPRDVIISLYFQDNDGTNVLTFDELAVRYTFLMDAWLAVREWEGLNWMETKYENTVADLEKEGSRVTKFLGLEWHERQARFFEHNREKPILSNNAPDVAKPVYKRAVGRWRVYEKHLAPALPILAPYCRIFGYD